MFTNSLYLLTGLVQCVSVKIQAATWVVFVVIDVLLFRLMFKFPVKFFLGRIFPSLRSIRGLIAFNQTPSLASYSTREPPGRNSSKRPNPDPSALAPPPMATLETLNFDNSALRSLPLDPKEDNSLRQVRGACFSRVAPTPVKGPRLVAHSSSAVALLDLPESEVLRPEFAEYFAGNRILPGSETAAHCYCGHQFGNFAGQLGDGTVVCVFLLINFLFILP